MHACARSELGFGQNRHFCPPIRARTRSASSPAQTGKGPADVKSSSEILRKTLKDGLEIRIPAEVRLSHRPGSIRTMRVLALSFQATSSLRKDKPMSPPFAAPILLNYGLRLTLQELFSDTVPATPVAAQSIEHRCINVMLQSGQYMDDETRLQREGLRSPLNLGIMAATLALYGASTMSNPVGWVANGLLIAGMTGLGVYMVWTVASLVIEMLNLIYHANCEDDLDKAARIFATIVILLAVTVVIGWLCKKASFMIKSGAVVIEGGTAAYARQAALAAANKAGMTAEHFMVLQRVADELGLIIGVRNTNPNSTWLIKMGAAAKPFGMNSHTSPTTGVVTVLNAAEKAEALNHSNGLYYVVERIAGKLVPRNRLGEVLLFDVEPIWVMEAGQVINGIRRMPVVGDYDLAAVIDPAALSRNLALVASRGKILPQWGNPGLLNSVINLFNGRIDQPRMMHFAHEGFASMESAGNITWFRPKGAALELNAAETAAWYKTVGRQPIVMPTLVKQELKNAAAAWPRTFR